MTDTYLGHIVGEQILGGPIKRGDGQEINAVLWFSDLRDFTGLNERMELPTCWSCSTTTCSSWAMR